MELSVYISNERIEIVAGTGSKSKAKIKKVYSLAVPEGTIMNSIITGEQRLQESVHYIKKCRTPVWRLTMESWKQMHIAISQIVAV